MLDFESMNIGMQQSRKRHIGLVIILQAANYQDKKSGYEPGWVPPGRGDLNFAQLRVNQWFGLWDKRHAKDDKLRLYCNSKGSTTATTAK